MSISEATEFTMGNEVRCTDGECGTLRRVVVDPVSRSLTHLVVEPEHHERDGHLVPVELVSGVGEQIELSCSLAEFEKLEDAQELRFVPGARGQWGYQQQDMLSWPYYGLGIAGAGVGLADNTAGNTIAAAEGETLSYERIPAGEVQVRRGEHVQATDGQIGRVQGLVIDPADHRVTHVLLDEGHLWGHKQVAIPIGSVTDVHDGVKLDLTKDQVRDLPPVQLDEQD
jgi:sporulation protein YlmC with PRC-barrel domain